MEKTGWGKSSRWYSKIVGETGHYYHRQLILPTVLSLLSLKPNESILDLGCGQGVLARALPEWVDYVGADISGALINEAKRLDQNKRHEYVTADVSLPIPGNRIFDHIVMILSLQNIKNLTGVFKTIKHHLRPGGDLILVLNHPCFRIPRQSGWYVDPSDKQQKRWINKYMAPMSIPITTHPSQRLSSKTWSFHYPLSTIVQQITQQGMLICGIEELTSDKESEGKYKKMENRSRAEIPLFMVIKAIKSA